VLTVDARGEAAPGTGAGAYARLLAAIGALAAGAAAVVVAALLVHGLPSTSSAASGSVGAPAPAPKTAETFPEPPARAVVFAAQAGRDVLGLGVVPRPDSVLLQASVVPYDENPPPYTVRFSVESAAGKATAAGAECGTGCFRATVPVAKPRSVTVSVSGRAPKTFAMPAAWPPPSGASIVARAAKVWLGLNTLVFRDRLGDGSAVLNTIWKVVAPDRLSYRVDTGEQSIVIGNRRWILPAGSKKWITTPQQPVEQPQPFWSEARNVHILGTAVSRGRPAWKISFFDPATPGWFTVLIDKRSTHTLELWMTATAHFMHDVYGPFNAPLSIVPPT
jgi:hypothetical protein